MKDFKLSLSNLGFFIQQVTKLLTNNRAKHYRVNICEWRDKRSLSQNALYWKWLTEIDKQAPLMCESTITGAEMWHEVFKHYYCKMKTVANKKAALNIKSTKMLDVGEMTFYLNKIENWCIDRGVILTIPHDSEYYKLMEQQNE